MLLSRTNTMSKSCPKSAPNWGLGVWIEAVSGLNSFSTCTGWKKLGKILKLKLHASTPVLQSAVTEGAGGTGPDQWCSVA